MGRKLLGAEDGKGVDREEGMGKSDRREGCKGVDREEGLGRSEKREDRDRG